MTVLLVHAAATWFMTGLIWFVQIVHYPLMGTVGADRWVEYQREHQKKTTFVVLPPMFIELSTAGWLLFNLYNASEGVTDDRLWSAWLAAGSLLAIWISTFALQVPLHQKLSQRFEPTVHRKLVQTNWIRTVLWTVRAIIVTTWLL